jgi:hypothetical protein
MIETLVENNENGKSLIPCSIVLNDYTWISDSGYINSKVKILMIRGCPGAVGERHIIRDFMPFIVGRFAVVFASVKNISHLSGPAAVQPFRCIFHCRRNACK